MSSLAKSHTQTIRRLEWDSQHFGIPVAEIVSPELTDDQLCETLAASQAEGMQLVYWCAARDRLLSSELLERFGGRLVNHRARFSAQLTDAVSSHRPTPGQPYFVRIFQRGPAPQTLLDLAVAAGGHSRFHVDPQIPAAKFRELYEIWMTRSVLRELADQVLVASPSAVCDDFVGTITVSETAGAGQIGLLAVRQDHRGCGVSSRLMAAAHDWLRERGAIEVSVVTQLENRSACSLYSGWGYQLAEERPMFHFWPPRRET